MKISIVIPVYNEEGNIKKVYQEVKKSADKIGGKYEIIFVNDGSDDLTQEKLKLIYKKDKVRVKVINFARNFGKSAAMDAGFKLAQGEIVFTIDGDGQDDPSEMGKFLKMINQGYGLVSGWRKERKDRFIKKHSSKVYNWAVNKMFGLRLHDKNCGFKAYSRELMKEIDLYGEMHRYVPVIAVNKGYRVGEVAVKHRERFSGQSKFGTGRFLNGFLDMLTIMYLNIFRHRPLHLFGYSGVLSFAVGVGLGVYLTYLKFFEGESIGTRPLLLFAVMLMIMGVQLIALGLLAEQITAGSGKVRNYRVGEVWK